MNTQPATRREIAAVAALTLLPLWPFLTRAVSLDAPVFFAVARQIVAAPGDPFGFQMVWDPTSPEAAVFNRNPPLFSYYLALWIAAFGESEALLHAAVLPFPLLAALSFLGIARRVAPGALAATALLVTAPAFLLLSTTFLLDVPVLACMLFAVYALLRGAEPRSWGWQLGAGLAAGAAGLTKYVGFSMAPLLVAGVVLLYPRRAGALARVLGVPLALWALWGAFTAHLYGTPHFWASSDLLVQKSLQPEEIWNQVLSTPIYYGGALVFPIFVAVRAVWRGVRGAEIAVLGLVAGAVALRWVLPEGEPSRRIAPEADHLVLGALGFAGATLLWSFCLRPRRFLESPLERLLMLWLGGLLVYAMLVNWHVNAADALLAAPPVLLLLFRTPELRPPSRSAAVWVAATLCLSLLLGYADARQANFYRDAARRVAAEIGEQPGQRWFVGHWGLQHYFEAEGFQAVLPPMYGRSVLAVGDWVVSARNVSQIDVSHPMEDYALREIWTWQLDSWLPLRTTNADAAAGFYSHHSGYVPFAFSTRPVERLGLGRVVAVRPAPAR